MTRFLTCLVLGAALAASLPISATAQGKACPPGLAKKTPACVPPGLAKKGVTAGDFTNQRSDGDEDDSTQSNWDTGDRIEPDRYVRLAPGDRITLDGEDYLVVSTDDGVLLRRNDDFWRLPPAAETGEYVIVDDQLVRVDEQTSEVLQIISLVDLLIN